MNRIQQTAKIATKLMVWHKSDGRNSIGIFWLDEDNNQLVDVDNWAPFQSMDDAMQVASKLADSFGFGLSRLPGSPQYQVWLPEFGNGEDIWYGIDAQFAICMSALSLIESKVKE